MKSNILSFVLLGFCFVWACRPKQIDPSLVLNGDGIFLKNIYVKGATEVKINNDLGIIQVTLPESYTPEFIDLDFTLGKDIFLGYNDLEGSQKKISNANSPENPTYRFVYAGTRPLYIYTQTGFGLNVNSYLIYVNQTNKKLQAEIEKIDSVYSYPDNDVKFNSVANFHLKITNHNGTFPNNPNKNNNFVLLKVDNHADTISLGNGQTNFWFNVEKFLPFEDKKFSLELISDNSKQILKDNFTFIRQKPKIYDNNQFGVFGIDRSFKVKGGIFLSNNRYSLRFLNDFLKNDIVLDAHFDDFHNLSVSSLSSMLVGSYIVEILENGTVLSRGVINIGKSEKASAIRAIKSGENNASGEYPSTKKEQLNKGEKFSILPSDFIASCYGIGISQEKLDNLEAPSLKLTNGFQETVLTPKKIIVWWAVATCHVIYFQYTIPKSTESGFYEAQLVYPDGRESLKYWNKIEIK